MDMQMRCRTNVAEVGTVSMNLGSIATPPAQPSETVMKPEWKDAPEWANWLAMDGDGIWVWFQDRPEWEPSANAWWLSADSDDDSAYTNATFEPDESGIDWDFAYDTLEQKP
jgi:hypothetical protein